MGCKPVFRFWRYILLLLALPTAILSAQHDYPQADIDRGGQLYRSTCVACHGQDGNLLEDVSLADPVFLAGMEDGQLIGIILNGIPDTAMLANTGYDESQAGNIVAYLRDMSAQGRITPEGDAGRGMAVYRASDCSDCHRIGTSGSRVGPNLSRIGLLRRTAEIEEALLDPDATVLPENRYVRLVTGAGTSLTGRLLNHDQVSVQLLDSNERLRHFNKAQLQAFELQTSGLMPSYAGKFNDSELEDLLTYLVSLKGGKR